MKILEENSSYQPKNKIILIYSQLLLSGIALGVFSWNIIVLAKNFLLENVYFDINPWTHIFFHPYESGLINYVFTCVSLSIYGFIFYLIENKKIESIPENINLSTLLSLLIASITILLASYSIPLTIRILVTMFISAIPFFYLIDSEKKFSPSKVLSAIPLLLLIAISIEPLQLIIGPTYLMNEYCDIYGETNLKGKELKKEYINNKVFIESLKNIDIDSVKIFYDLNNKIQGKYSQAIMLNNIDFLYDLKDINLQTTQSFLLSSIGNNDLSETIFLKGKFLSTDFLLNNLKNINIESIKNFYLRNRLEYFHQNVTRGQINHIGHVLNPINEYVLGKPLGEIYAQYGLGFTFILKKTMDLFGGLSIENYYKCYIYYVIYFLTFLFLLYFLFKDSVYIFGAFAFVAVAYFYQGYMALILAPGILPLIHFFDATVLILLLLFFRKNSLLYLGLAALLTLASIIINRQFGFMLAAALIGSTLLYIIENKQSKKKHLWLSTLFIATVLMFLVSHFTTIGTIGKTFAYFILGFFSWSPDPVIIFLTICYLVVSYSFLFSLKEERHYLKYIYLFVFIYTQGLCVYYYWSGLSNHLPTIIPFAGLQLFLMIYLARELFFTDNLIASKYLHNATKLISLSLIFITLLCIKDFYKQKKKFVDIFDDIKVYEWNYARAHLVTTINSEPITESISLIVKYSGNENGIYIISKYDNLLPFLSKKYSLMPFYEMNWHLFSPVDTQNAINKILSHKPEYVFVDSNTDNYSIDPWIKIYNDISTSQERTSRIERYRELYSIFNAIKADYEPIQEGQLITVYKRKSL